MHSIVNGYLAGLVSWTIENRNAKKDSSKSDVFFLIFYIVRDFHAGFLAWIIKHREEHDG